MQRIDFDEAARVLYITYLDGEVAKTVETRPGVYMDFDAEGRRLGIEITTAEGYELAKRVFDSLDTALELSTVA